MLRSLHDLLGIAGLDDRPAEHHRNIVADMFDDPEVVGDEDRGDAEILPEVDIKCILVNGQYKWVHTDSGKETYLSQVIGQAIEKVQPNPAMADEITETEEEF